MVWIRAWLSWSWRKIHGFLESLEQARRYGVNVLVLLVVALVLYATYRATVDTITIVEPISVPKALEEQGYTAAIVAQRLMDQIHAINDSALTKKARTRIGSESDSASLASIQLPAAGFSFRSLIGTLRGLRGTTDSKIAGEIVIRSTDEKNKPTSLALLLRMEHYGKRTVQEIHGTGVDDLLLNAAGPAIEVLDPNVMVAYYYATLELKKAETLAETVSLTADKDTAKWALLHRGLLRMDMHDPVGAIEFYTQAKALDPKFAPAYTAWAFALLAMEKHNEAIDILKGVVAIDSRSTQAYVAWGDALLRLEKPAEAIEKFKQALEVNPRAESARVGQAHALIEQGHADEAKEICRSVLLLHRTAEAVYACGAVYARLGDVDLAEKAYRQAIAMQPRLISGHTGLARLHMRKGEFAVALHKYEYATILDPQNVDAFEAWAAAHMIMSEFDKAVEKYEVVIRIVPRHPWARVWAQKAKEYRDRGLVP